MTKFVVFRQILVFQQNLIHLFCFFPKHVTGQEHNNQPFFFQSECRPTFLLLHYAHQLQQQQQPVSCCACPSPCCRQKRHRVRPLQTGRGSFAALEYREHSPLKIMVRISSRSYVGHPGDFFLRAWCYTFFRIFFCQKYLRCMSWSVLAFSDSLLSVAVIRATNYQIDDNNITCVMCYALQIIISTENNGSNGNTIFQS